MRANSSGGSAIGEMSIKLMADTTRLANPNSLSQTGYGGNSSAPLADTISSKVWYSSFCSTVQRIYLGARCEPTMKRTRAIVEICKIRPAKGRPSQFFSPCAT